MTWQSAIALRDIVDYLPGERLRGVIHAGAHVGEEVADYYQAGATSVLAFEPLAVPYAQLSVIQHPGFLAVNKALGAYSAHDVPIYLADNVQSSSLRAPAKHLKLFPYVHFREMAAVDIVALDEWMCDNQIAPAAYNLLVLDVQGYEDAVLLGAARTLKHIDAVFTEVSLVALYEGQPLLADIDKLMKTFGFARAMFGFSEPGVWGDALYLARI